MNAKQKMTLCLSHPSLDTCALFIELSTLYICIYIYIYIYCHHTTCESTCDTLASSAANQGSSWRYCHSWRYRAAFATG